MPTIDDLERALASLTARVAALEASTPGSTAVTVLQAGQLLGCGRTEVFALLKSKRLNRARRSGRKVMVTRASVEALLRTRS